MLSRIIILLKAYGYWLLFFLVQKPIFMLVNYRMLGEVHAADWWQVILHAFPLDASVAAYFTMPLGLLLIVFCWWRQEDVGKALRGYSVALILIALLTFVADCMTFPAWGYHLDKSVFQYLKTPIEVMACMSDFQWWSFVFVLVIGFFVCWIAFLAMYLPLFRGKTVLLVDTRERIYTSLVLLILTALFFIPARGSLTTSTMNTGRVYFSDNQQLNLAAVNPLFNIFESLGENTFNTAKYTYMSDAEKACALSALGLPHTATPAQRPSVLKYQRPDIIFLILESFSANAREAMPCLQQLAAEGVYFANAYASSYRTDRGVVAALSAFPGQPTSSLMTVPAKSQHLPVLSLSLREAGYRLKFWYGGDEDFTNMRSYLVHGGFQDRVCDKSFPVEERLSKWGAHDHLLFQRLQDELLAERADTTPSLHVVLTLSSHEPFEVPAIRRSENPYLNSIAYTDSCIGALADALRASDRWDNTLLVLVADHGYPYPGNVQNFEPRRYHIPMLLAGGAVKEAMRVETVCSQIDLVPTLLSQMGMDYSAYGFGKDILDSAATPYAFYSFNDGFGLITPTDTVVIDAKADKLLIGSAGESEQQARAYIQHVMQIVDSL